MTNPTPIRKTVKETRHVVRSRQFSASEDPVSRASGQLLRSVDADGAFTGTVTIHVFRGVASSVCTEDRASIVTDPSDRVLTRKE